MKLGELSETYFENVKVINNYLEKHLFHRFFVSFVTVEHQNALKRRIKLEFDDLMIAQD